MDLFVYCPQCRYNHLRPGESGSFSKIVNGPTTSELDQAFARWKEGMLPVTFYAEGSVALDLKITSASRSHLHQERMWIFEGNGVFHSAYGTPYRVVVLYNIDTQTGEMAH